MIILCLDVVLGKMALQITRWKEIKKLEGGLKLNTFILEKIEKISHKLFLKSVQIKKYGLV